jgi:hypothetical protein
MTALLTAPSTTKPPALVEDYVERVLPAGGLVPRRVRINQTGEMWLKPGARSFPCTAVEEFAVEEVAFTWRAKVRIAPLVSMRVVDGYNAGKGSLEGRLFGMAVTRSRGQMTTEGEAMRYLAELAWAPHAMRVNRELEWRELEEDIVEVSARAGSSKVAVDLRFDRVGDILATFAHRPRIEGKQIVARPWMGVFSDYAVLGGIRIPTRAEVHWELPDGPFTYWRGTVTSVELTNS